MINLLKKLKSVHVIFLFLIFLLLLKLLFTLCSVFLDYFYIIDFLCWRLFFILCILVLLQGFLNLSFIKDLKEEMDIFNEGPPNKSSFMANLRKYHFSLLISGYLSYSLAVTIFVEDPFVSNLLGIVALINLTLYLVQSVVYINEYIKKSFKFDKTISDGNRNKKNGQTRTMFTAANTKKVATICVECVKTAVTLGGGAEVVYKLTHGGMNDVSPWRQSWLNQNFPEDKTKIWTESKAASALHYRAMGYSHDSLYDSVGDKLIKASAKK